MNYLALKEDFLQDFDLGDINCRGAWRKALSDL